MTVFRVLLISLSTTALLASDCVEPSQREAFRWSTIVFRGKVENVEDVAAPPPEYIGGGKVPMQPADSSEPQLVTFAVDQLWKGRLAKKIKMFGFVHPPEGSGYRFRLGTEYVVYGGAEVNWHWEPLDRLRDGSPAYQVGMCPLRIRTDIESESRLLGKGKMPLMNKMRQPELRYFSAQPSFQKSAH